MRAIVYNAQQLPAIEEQARLFAKAKLTSGQRVVYKVEEETRRQPELQVSRDLRRLGEVRSEADGKASQCGRNGRCFSCPAMP